MALKTFDLEDAKRVVRRGIYQGCHVRFEEVLRSRVFEPPHRALAAEVDAILQKSSSKWCYLRVFFGKLVDDWQFLFKVNDTRRLGIPSASRVSLDERGRRTNMRFPGRTKKSHTPD